MSSCSRPLRMALLAAPALACWLLPAPTAGADLPVAAPEPIAASPGSVVSPAAASPKPAVGDTARLRQRMEEVMEREGIPGAGVALVSADSLLWLEGLGAAHREEEVPVDTTTAFRAGLAGVSVVGLVLMRLSEEGAVALDERVATRVPDAAVVNPWEGTHPLRLVHLMEHTGGLSEVSLGTLAGRGAGTDLGQVLAEDPLLGEVRWPPGQHRSRSRAGPALAARAVEHLTGTPFEEVARDAVFEPLAMEVAGYGRGGELEERLAQGYGAGGRRPVAYRESPLAPVDGLALTPRELARVAQLFLGRGQAEGVSLLGSGAVEWMETPSTGLARQAGLGADYGFGVDAWVEEGFVFRGHGGAVGGFSAEWGYFPEADLGYALMANSEGDGFRELRSEVRGHLVADLEPPEPESRAALPPRRIQELAGTYERITSTRDALDPLHRLVGILRVGVADDADAHLEIRRLGGEAGLWVATAGNRFRPVAEPVSRLGEQTDEAGRRLLVATGEELEGSYAPVPAWSLWTRWVVAGLVLLGALSAVAFALVRIPSWWRGRLREGERLSVRALPAGAAASLLAALLVLWVGSGQPVARLGAVSIWSLAYPALTVAFALLAVAGAVQAFRAREEWCPRPVRTHARVVSVANLLALLYLAAFGLLAARPWLF